MLKTASLFSQILGQVSRIDFLQTGHQTPCLSVIQRAFVPGPSSFRCFFAILQGPIVFPLDLCLPQLCYVKEPVYILERLLPVFFAKNLHGIPDGGMLPNRVFIGFVGNVNGLLPKWRK